MRVSHRCGGRCDKGRFSQWLRLLQHGSLRMRGILRHGSVQNRKQLVTNRRSIGERGECRMQIRHIIVQFVPLEPVRFNRRKFLVKLLQPRAQIHLQLMQQLHEMSAARGRRRGRIRH